MRDTYTLVTPENVRFELELAGLGSRGLAWFIDFVLMASMSAVIGAAVFATSALLGGFALALYFVSAFLIQWGYGALWEYGWNGQTPGKAAVGLRVLQSSGARIGFAQAAIRNLVRIVDLLPLLYLVGGVSALLDRRGRRLGDLLADTIVVRRRRSPRPSTLVATDERFNSFLQDPAVVHAASRVSPPERDAMLGLAVRREGLPLPVRYALFAKLAKHLEGKLGIARPAHFSEEMFVLNLSAVVLGLSARGGRGGRA